MVQYRDCANAATCHGHVTLSGRLKFCTACRKAGHRAPHGNQHTIPDTTAPPKSLAEDREKLRLQLELARVKDAYKRALGTIDEREQHLDALGYLAGHVEVQAITPKAGRGTSEATPVIVGSDWHIEEEVGPEVGGLNTFTLDIARTRATEFFQAALRLVRLLNQDVQIHTVVLALLGDYITNEIHGAENAETNQLQPTHALVEAQNLIISGITFLLEHSPYQFVIVCKSGNHGRTTQMTRFSAETGHSLEYLMFLHLKAYFRSEDRIRFVIEPGIHSYLQVYDQTIRFHHGHAIKYGGGVGGITIPVNKAIAAWDQARRADIDVFGHFHQYTIHNKFVCNGSLIGYNGYAMAIKAQFERPQQALFLIDKRRGKTAHWPILFSK